MLWTLGIQSWSQEKESPTKAEFDELKAVVDGINESATEYRSYVDLLRKIKVTGYLQTQFRLTDVNGSPASFSGGNFPTNSNKVFQVRRGRIKINYDNVLTQFVIQFDAIQTGFTLKDAYLSITEPWMQSFGFQMGVFDRPFGYEISFSSGSRETPERSRIFQTLFPGERELGAKLFFAPQLGSLSFLRADVGVFNGSGPTANEFDSYKDFIGHVGAQFPFDDIGAGLDLGISGYFGAVRNNTKFLLQNGERQVGGVVFKGFNVDSALSNLGDGVTRRYIGADAQFYYDVPGIGGMTLRGEYIAGKQPGGSDFIGATIPSGNNPTTVSPSTQPSGPIYLRNFAGWYINLIQNIGTDHQLLAKYDVYDPNTNVSTAEFVAANNLSPADVKFSTLGLGYIYHWDGNVKFILYYEWVKNETFTQTGALRNALLTPFQSDLRDNVLTFRVQYRFPF